MAKSQHPKYLLRYSDGEIIEARTAREVKNLLYIAYEANGEKMRGMPALYERKAYRIRRRESGSKKQGKKKSGRRKR